ncbi:LysR family transcriptional regulator [bacterium]|nr:LysR family transcriptional regulator [bacterium]
MDVRLHQLEGFYYTGVAGGYARAAAAMPYPVSAPAVYQQVRKLEGTLGVPLVALAKSRRTVLTPEGRALHEFIAPFFSALRPALEGIRRSESQRLVLAGDGALARALAAPTLAELARRRVGLEIRFSERDSREVARLVASGEVDAGLALLGMPQEGIREEALVVMRVALCVPASHPIARRRRAPRPEDLAGIALCVYERGAPGRAILEKRFRDAGLTLKVAAEASTADMLRAFVAAGLAPAFVPIAEPARRGAHRPIRREGEVVFFDMTDLVPGEPTRFGIITRAGAAHPAVSEWRRLLQHEVSGPTLGAAPALPVG